MCPPADAHHARFVPVPRERRLHISVCSLSELDVVFADDDFVVLTSPEYAEPLGEDILEWFNTAARELYDQEDRERGHVEVLNRRHVTERFPLMSLTIALVSTDRVPVTHLAELIDIAQELKAHGKGIPGSVLVGERRRREGSENERNVA